MKKHILLFISLIMVLSAALIGCNNGSADDATENRSSLASINFEAGNVALRSIAINPESLAADALYWAYEAEWKGDGGITPEGATTSKTAVKSGTGLASVGGFTPGNWDFKLYGCKNADFTGQVFYGTSGTVTLAVGTGNSVNVFVDYETSGSSETATIVIGDITLKGADINDYTLKAFTCEPSATCTVNEGNKTITAQPGTYTVIFTYKKGGYYYIAKCEVTAFDNITTTISGELDIKKPEIYTIILNKNGGSADGSATVTYDSTTLKDLIHATNASAIGLTGYWSSYTGGKKVANVDGTLIANVSEYTDSSGKWIRSYFSEYQLFARWHLAGALSGEFSVSADKKVHFSKGNLVATYNGTSYDWGFAEHQYDYVGNAAGNTSIDSQTNGSKVDLFGWSTAATNYGISTSTGYTYTGSFVDWGASIAKRWHTLTAAEWDYLFSQGSYINSTRAGRYACGVTVAGKANCVVLYPDDYTGTMVSDGDTTSYADAASWAAAEANGVVCLPVAGNRKGSTVDNVESYGDYWTSSSGDVMEDRADYLNFNSLCVYSVSSDFRYSGKSVRLVVEE